MLIPGLGSRTLTSLSVPVVQDFLNQRQGLPGCAERALALVDCCLDVALAGSGYAEGDSGCGPQLAVGQAG